MGSIKYLCKLIGTLLVVLGSAGTGLCLIKERRDSLCFTEKTVQMLKTLQHLVVYEKRTLAEACGHLSKDGSSPFADCFGRIVNRIQDHEGESFCLIWEDEFLKETDKMYFTDEEAERLKNVPFCMKAAEPVRTAQMLDDTIAFFEEQVKKRKEQAHEREKVILSVCTMAGMLISILFW